ncbi:WD40 repeat-like protein [Rhodotorula sp. JG-1b]|nr:WD40 repeat-like protein [Rhodotorula sp. JG-1b]
MTKARLVQTLEGHQDRAWHLAWNPASPLLASCSTDKSIRLYSYAPNPSSDDPTAPPYRFSLQTTIPNSHSRTVRSLEFSATGATLATASFDATVGIWCQVSEAGLDDGAGGGGGGGGGEWEPVDPLEGHESECKSVAWSADGRLLASCSRDKSVWVWEAVGPADFECLAVLMEHSQDVKCVTWHPTDELLASASYDDTIKLYAADPYDDEWQCTHTLTAHSGTVWSLSFSPCGRYLASAGDDLVIKLWERVSKWRWEERGEIRDAHERTIYAIDWKAGGAPSSEGGLGRIVSAGGDGRIKVFQMKKKTRKKKNPRHVLVAQVEDAHGVSDVNHVAWKKTKDMFASAGDDGLVKVWVVDP